MTTKLKKIFYQYDEKIFELEDWERLHKELYNLATNSVEETQELYEIFEGEKDIEMQISLALILAELGNYQIRSFLEKIFLSSEDMHHIIEACVMYILLDEPIGKEKLLKLASSKELPPHLVYEAITYLEPYNETNPLANETIRLLSEYLPTTER